jgi:hypothetical protein
VEHPDLKSLFDDIQMDDEELHRCRNALRESLSSTRQAAPLSFADRMRDLFHLPVLQYALPALVIAAAILLYQQMQQSPLESVELARLQEFVARHGDRSALYQQTESMQQSDSVLQRLNGLYVLSALGTDQENVLASVQGLIEDPRAEFRRYYLDYLLTHADEAYYDLEYLERLLDRERDPECRQLLLELISLAEGRQRSRPAFI